MEEDSDEQTLQTLDAITKHQTYDDTPGVSTYEMEMSAKKKWLEFEITQYKKYLRFDRWFMINR